MKILIILLSISTQVLSQDFTFDKANGKAVPTFIGQVKILKGKVLTKNDKGSNPTGTGDRFKTGDTLVTNEKSMIKVQLIDDTVISIGPNSELRFDQFDFTNKNERKSLVSLIKGQISADVRHKAPNPGDIKFRSKYTSMGIRGTYILMNNQLVKEREVVQYALLSGMADVRHNTTEVKMVPGYHVRIVAGEDNLKSGNDLQNLTEEEMKFLKAPGSNEEKEIKPFLPYIDPTKVTLDSPLYTLLHGGQEVPEDGEDLERSDKTKPGWRENLKKLNEKLKENQKKR